MLLINLMVGDTANQDNTGNAGALDAVVHGMRAHPLDATLQMKGCGAITNMTDGNQANSVRAYKAGAIRAIGAAISAHSNDLALVDEAMLARTNIRRGQGDAA